MSEHRDPRVYLDDIIAASSLALQFVAGMTFTQFEQDVRTQYAVIRAIGIIGEAARSATPEFREQFPNVPWRQMTGMRDRVIHGYDDVELLVIWKTVQEDLPQLISRIEAILNALSAEIEEGDQG